MEADAPPLDFPAEQVWDLLEELYRIIFEQLRISWKIALTSLENHRKLLMLELLGWRLKGVKQIQLFASHIPAKRIRSILLYHLEDRLLSLRSHPLWMQVIIVCVWVFIIRRFQAALGRNFKRRYNNRLRRRLSMKSGRSEILQGRTSLVYGAAGELMDEEYLEEITSGVANKTARGRFGSFDFFGINNNTNDRMRGKYRNRKRSQSSSDDYQFGTGVSTGYTTRKRTSSTESLGNPTGAALVRSRSESMESLSGFFQAFKDYRENGPKISDKYRNLNRNQNKSNNNYKMARLSYGIDQNNDEKRNISTSVTLSNQIIREKQSSKRFRKERLGSMDVYYKSGKNQPLLTAAGNNRRFKSSSWGDGSSFEGKGENYFKNFGHNEEMQYLYDEFGLVTLSHKVEYFGPFRSILNCGSTFVPPPPFEVVSRKIGSSEVDLPLKRIIQMDLLKGSISVIEPTTSVSLNKKYDCNYDNIDEISIIFKKPIEGGVFCIYKKGTPKQGPDWKEHTFESAHAAAQFQLDLLVYQVLGKPFRQIFEALHLVHQGGISYEGQEFVLHDKIRGNADNKAEKDGSKTKNKPKQSMETTHFVAWDDAMRAMSSIPTVRIALERLWLSHNRPSVIRSKVTKTAKDKSKIALENEKATSAEMSLIKEEYIKNRLLLGPVDFYRLFVPSLPETAIPEGDFNNRRRMEQLLCWRKRVARASVLVRSYTRARLVANRGWSLDCVLPPTGTSAAADSLATGALGDHGGEQITKRFAYDGNENNHLRDINAKNEIYEASVSRDVLCHVRSFDYLNSDVDGNGEGVIEENQRCSDYYCNSSDHYHSQKHFVLSPYQAYTYVESHYFKATEDMLGEGGALHPSRDPIEIFPSLKEILVRHPDLDFFVDCLSNAEEKILIVNLHVRSLAKGIDTQFDNVIDRFSNATEESRKRKLYLMVQLGNRVGFSFLGWLFLKLLSLYLRLTETCRDSPINLESTRDRYGFPGFRVGDFFKTYHFGGSLQPDSDKPSNYIGLTKCTASYHDSFLGKIILDHLQRIFFESTVDLTFVIEGERNDELPERALSSLRIVRVNPNKVSKDPRPYLTTFKEPNVKNSKMLSSPFSQLALQGAVQYSLNSVRSIVHAGLPLLSPEKKKQRILNGSPLRVISEGDEIDTVGTSHMHLIRKGGSMDPLEKAIDMVIDILRSVIIPCRDMVDRFDLKNSHRLEEEIQESGLMVMSRVPVLRMFDRSDIGRYIVHFDFNLRVASERLVETASWRGETFPIDKRRCRIELQNGQFFQQGFDKDNNPVFYFRNLCRGPWRGDSKATILAILYRLDRSLVELCKVNPETKATLIVLMGHAKCGARKRKKRGSQGDSDSTIHENDDHFEIDDESDSERGSPDTLLELPSEEEIKENTGNPRISPNEKWMCHTNKEMMRNLFETLIAHYPGRLSRILVVKGRGRNHYYRDQIQGKMILRKILSSIDKRNYQKLLSKVQFLNKVSGLTQHVALKDLPTVVGGIAPIHHLAYEF